MLSTGRASCPSVRNICRERSGSKGYPVGPPDQRFKVNQRRGTGATYEASNHACPSAFEPGRRLSSEDALRSLNDVFYTRLQKANRIASGE